jgi:hypothetical protein
MTPTSGARGSAVGWGSMLQAGRSRVRFHIRLWDLFNVPNSSSRIMTLESTQSLTDFFSSSLLPFGSLLPLLEHGTDFSVSWSFTDGRTPWTGDQLVASPLPKYRTTQTQKNAHTHQTFIPWVGFEPTIPASERAKTVHASARSATVTGFNRNEYEEFSWAVNGGRRVRLTTLLPSVSQLSRKC